MKWRPLAPGLAAAALVEAGAGVAATGCLVHIVQQADTGELITDMFIAAALAAGLVDGGLVPGWIWAPGRFEIVPVLARLVISTAMLAVALGVGFVTALVLLVVGVPIYQAFPVQGDLGDVIGFGLFSALVFTVAGGTVGLGAALAQAADLMLRSKPVPRGRIRSHLLGGVAAVFLVLGVIVAANTLRHYVNPLYVLPAVPLAIVLGGLPHNLLVLRDALRRGDGVLDLPAAMPRAALCATVLFLVGAALLATAT